MTNDHIYLNGELVLPETVGSSLNALLSTPFIYQDIHTFGHKAAYLSEHLQLMKDSAMAVFGKIWMADQDKIESQITELLSHNKYPRNSNHVRIYLFNHKPGRPDTAMTYIIEAVSALFYSRYVIWHKRVTGDIFCSNIPFAGHQSSFSLQTAMLADNLAAADGLDRGITVTPEGICLSSDDQPLFIVKDKTVNTTPVTAGAPDTVMRKLVITACEDMGISLHERPVTTDMLDGCDEIFSCNVQGLVDFLGIGESRLFNFTVKKILPYINRVTWGG